MLAEGSKFSVPAPRRFQIFFQVCLIVHGEGTQIFLDGGGQALMGGQPLHGVWSPPIPPMLGSPEGLPKKSMCNARKVNITRI